MSESKKNSNLKRKNNNNNNNNNKINYMFVPPKMKQKEQYFKMKLIQQTLKMKI